MKTLIICIDRDNDLGEKAGIKSPIIGRQANIDAALKLGITDPEESDTNTLFGGIKAYDELIATGESVELVSFAGDSNVGIISDKIIANQLDEVLKKYDAKSAIVISDGADDETLMPIIQSRMKIDSVKRVTVVQSERIENTYYILSRIFSNPRFSHMLFVPPGLALIIYSIFLFIGNPDGAIVGMSAIIGLYLLYKGFKFDDSFNEFLEKMKKSFYDGNFSFFTYLTSIIIGIVAIIQGASQVFGHAIGDGVIRYEPLSLFIIFINASVWWFVLAFLFANFGRLVDRYINKKPIVKNISAMLFIIAFGLMTWGVSLFILSSENMGGFTVPHAVAFEFLSYSFIGFMLIVALGIKILKKGRTSDDKNKKQNKIENKSKSY